MMEMDGGDGCIMEVDYGGGGGRRSAVGGYRLDDEDTCRLMGEGEHENGDDG